MNSSKSLSTAALAALLSFAGGGAVWAQPVQIEAPWVRATVPGQKGTGAFMKLTAPKATQLVGVTSPAAGVAEVHEMKMDGDVMRMRAVPSLPLPAGQTVELKPGGYHLMLLDLKKPLPKDTTVPLTLVFKDAQGVETRADVQLPVLTSAPGGAAHGSHGGHGHKH